MSTSTPAELRKSVRRLRLQELQAVLQAANLKTQGLKGELQERLEEAIRNSEDLRLLSSLIREQQGKSGSSHSSTSTRKRVELNSVTVSKSNSPHRAVSSTNPVSTANAKRLNTTDVWPTILPLDLRKPSAIVEFKPLAFYDQLSVVREPQRLEVFSLANGRSQETRVSLTLTTEQLSAIGREAHFHKSLGYTEHTVQVQLRFCRLDSSKSEQEDAFPSSIMVRMNDRAVALPPLIPTNRAGVEPKRPGRPLDVTEHCKMLPEANNVLQITWNIDAAVYSNRPANATTVECTHAFAVFLVRKLPVSELLSRLQHRQPLTALETQKLIAEKLRVACDDSDSEAELAVASQSITVSLLCPISKTRIQTAVRGRDCSHVQCFDATTYLAMNEKKPTWLCPVCDRAAPYLRLAADEFLQSILDSTDSQSLSSVAFRADGTWHNPNDDRGTCVLSSGESDEEKSPFPSCSVSASRESFADSNSRADLAPRIASNSANPVIDLTASDDESAPTSTSNTRGSATLISYSHSRSRSARSGSKGTSKRLCKYLSDSSDELSDSSSSSSTSSDSTVTNERVQSHVNRRKKPTNKSSTSSRESARTTSASLEPSAPNNASSITGFPSQSAKFAGNTVGSSNSVADATDSLAQSAVNQSSAGSQNWWSSIPDGSSSWSPTLPFYNGDNRTDSADLLHDDGLLQLIGDSQLLPGNSNPTSQAPLRLNGSRSYSSTSSFNGIAGNASRANSQWSDLGFDFDL